MRMTTLGLTAALFFIPALGIAASTADTPTQASKTFSDSDRAAIESIIKDYLVTKHPEVLKEAFDELQHREQLAADAKNKEAVSQQNAKIYNDPDTPVGGNPKGDVSVVEFFDFQCGYCKMAEEGVEKLIKDDKGVKFIYKDYPILGPVSTIASKAALASVRQNKYIVFHDALMSKKEHLTEDTIYQTAKSVGIDVDKLKKDMADEVISKQVEAALKLGNDIGVRGTPMFIIGDQVFPGAIQYDQMKKAVEDARAAAKK